MNVNQLSRAVALFALCIATAVSLISCGKTENAETRWRIDNEQAFNKYGGNTEYTKATIDGNSAHIYMKWLHRGEGKQKPISTSRVYMHYQVFYLVNPPGTLLDGNYTVEESMLFSLHRGANQSTIEGFCMAVQNMVVGDECEAILPWYLAYGAEGGPSQKPRSHSALRFVLKLDSIVPEKVPQ